MGKQLTTNRQGKALSDEWIERLWVRMQAHFGGRWIDHWAGLGKDEMAEVKSEWARQLYGFSGDEIKRGLDMLEDWIPSLNRFKLLCRPVVDPEVAWVEAAHGATARERGEFGNWSSPVVYWAYVEFGGYDLRHLTYKQGEKHWKQCLALAQQLADEGALQPIPAPAAALPAPGASVTDKEIGRQKAAELVASVAQAIHADRPAVAAPAHADPLALRGDYKDWARRMLLNPQGKSITSINMAKQALGLHK